MKLLIENQCLCTFLFITSFLNSNGGLIWAHVITLHDTYTHPDNNDSSEIYL